MRGVLASIPSPSSGAIHLGPLQLRAYGFMIALGVVAAVWLLGRRMEARGIGTRDHAAKIGFWSVLTGVLGSRAYHVVTDWHRFDDRLGDIPKIWQGGLGIPGALMVGIPVGVFVAKRQGIRGVDIATAAAPAIPLGQAIARFGNWWNQELFGRPTDLPWALEIDDRHLPAGYASGTTFHPAFLYESLGNFALCGILLWIDRARRPRPGRLMAMYLMGYAALRFGVESLRIDPAREIGGVRVNTWLSVIVFAAAAGYLVWERRHPTAELAVVADMPVEADVPAGTDIPVDAGSPEEPIQTSE